MATFSGRVTPPKVTMGAVARLRRSTWRRASALAIPSGSGSGCRMRATFSAGPSRSRTACTRSSVRRRATSTSSRSPTMSAQETLRRFSRTRWSSSPLVVVTRTFTSGRDVESASTACAVFWGSLKQTTATASRPGTTARKVSGSPGSP